MLTGQPGLRVGTAARSGAHARPRAIDVRQRQCGKRQVFQRAGCDNRQPFVLPLIVQLPGDAAQEHPADCGCLAAHLHIGLCHTSRVGRAAFPATALPRREMSVQRACGSFDVAPGRQLDARHAGGRDRPQPAAVFSQRELQQHGLVVEYGALDLAGAEGPRLRDGGISRALLADLCLQALVLRREPIDLLRGRRNRSLSAPADEPREFR